MTLTFVPDAYGDGTEVRVLAGGPGGTLTPTTLPPLHTRATIEETESLHQAPFAFILHVTGRLGGRPGFHFGDPTTAPELGCPPSGAFHFVIRAAGASGTLVLPVPVVPYLWRISSPDSYELALEPLGQAASLADGGEISLRRVSGTIEAVRNNPSAIVRMPYPNLGNFVATIE